MTELWAHQRECLDASCDMPAAAIHWEPRVGKSRVVIETAAYLWDRDGIDAAVVIAPNGVHLNWTRDQLPLYWDRRDDETLTIEWRSARTDTKKFRDELQRALEFDGFVWFVANVEALSPPSPSKSSKLVAYLERFMRRRRCLLAVDESHLIKSFKAKRTKAAMRLARACPYRRTLTGTPTPLGPFDLWSQFQVLDPKILGGLRYHAFRHRYGEWKRVRYGTGPTFDELVEYRNLDELARLIAPFTFESNKEDLFDLPDRVFVRRYFEMNKEHERVYRQLRDELVARLDSGETISAPLAIVNLMRLQQVSRGHVTDEAGDVVDLGDPYPADEAVLELVRENEGKTVVWCRFVHDVERLDAALAEEGIGHVRCDGTTPVRERPEFLRRFREDDDVRAWVGTPATGGLGVDLGSASLMIFHSHGFDLAQRLQALERNYGTSQRADRIGVVDLVAADTVDERALAVLERKEDLSRQLTREGLRELLR